MKKKVIYVLLAVVLIGALCGCGKLYFPAETDPVTDVTEENPQGWFEVHYLDVGQADATLVVCDGEFLLIDGGNAGDSSLLYAYLKEMGAKEIKYMICTHVHEDHVGGLSGALNYARVETVFCPTDSWDSEGFANFQKYLAAQGKGITIPEAGTRFNLGTATCQILAVNSDLADVNDTSIVLRIEYGETSFLFSGDAGQNVEAAILDAGFDIRSTVLKVPHHGSDTSLSDRWLASAMPEYAVISVGKCNSYGHPDESILRKLREEEVAVFRTDLQGHIVCKSDGIDVRFEVQKNPNADVWVQDAPVSDRVEPTASEDGSVISYVINTKSEQFHRPDCSGVAQMKEENRQETTLSREDLIALGYSPCGNCKP